MARAEAALSEELVLKRLEKGVARLTLNRPGHYNALSLGLMRALEAELAALAEEPVAQVVVIEGAGKGFCAGHDLKEIRQLGGRAALTEVFAQCSRLMLAVLRLPKPVIAQVHGVATAAGCQLVASCDLAVAAASARFATPGVNIGLFCSTPMVALSRNLGRKQAMRMLLTGELVSAEAAVALGLINEAVPDEELAAAVDGLAAKIASKSPFVLEIGKKAFYRQLEMGLEEAYDYTSEVMVANMLSQDAAEGIDAFIGKREPRWRGC